MKKVWTGERLETTVFGRQVVDHLHRYAIAQEYCNEKVVLDIACGEGYGSNIISKVASQVYGVDIDSGVIADASAKYGKAGLDFMVGSTSAIPLEDATVDVVVSFETIEHHDEHEEMMAEIKRVLKPGGVILISTPDKLYYTDLRNYNNPYHVKELYESEFTSLISKYFSRVQLLQQKHINGTSVINPKTDNLKVYSGSFSNIGLSAAPALFLVCIASDHEFEMQQHSILDGQEVMVGEIKSIQQNLYNSPTYRTGKLILAPAKFIRKMLRKR